MRLGRLFFAGAVILGLAYFALRSPIPAADPRFLEVDVADAGAAASVTKALNGRLKFLRGNAAQVLP